MNIEQSCMQLILKASSAKAHAFEALRSIKNGNAGEADQQLEAASSVLLEAHKIQTEIIQTDAGKRLDEVPLLLIHAQDHLMNAMSQRDLIEEMMEMAQKQNELADEVRILTEALKKEGEN